MTISFRAGSNTEQGGGTSVVVSKPTGTSAGDGLTALVYIEENANPPAGLTAPSGWTLQQSYKTTGGEFWAGVYTKIAGGSEPASYTWSWTSTRYAMGIIVAFSATATIAYDMSSTGTEASSSTITYPSVTTSAAGAMLVGLGASFGGGEGTPAGWSVGNNPPPSCGIFYKTQASAGASGTYTGSCASSANIGFTLSWIESAGGATKAPPPYRQAARYYTKRRAS